MMPGKTSMSSDGSSMMAGNPSMMAENPPMMAENTGMMMADTPAMMSKPPTVVELYQSQGCNSCPPANDNIIRLTEDPEMLVLTYEVTYWDRLGWKDTFGNIAFDDRQREYGQALKKRGVYTPQVRLFSPRSFSVFEVSDTTPLQVIVNGVVDGVGASQRDLNSIIQKGTEQAAATHGTVTVEVSSSAEIKVSGKVPSSKAVVYLIRYDPRTIDIYIARGENGGRNLPHKNIVKDVTRLGSFNGGEQTYSIPQMAGENGLKFAVLVQAGPGGPILGAARG